MDGKTKPIKGKFAMNLKRIAVALFTATALGSSAAVAGPVKKCDKPAAPTTETFWKEDGKDAKIACKGIDEVRLVGAAAGFKKLLEGDREDTAKEVCELAGTALKGGQVTNTIESTRASNGQSMAWEFVRNYNKAVADTGTEKHGRIVIGADGKKRTVFGVNAQDLCSVVTQEREVAFIPPFGKENGQYWVMTVKNTTGGESCPKTFTPTGPK